MPVTFQVCCRMFGHGSKALTGRPVGRELARFSPARSQGPAEDLIMGAGRKNGSPLGVSRPGVA